jgi:putative aldouronate transport system substrate-binding protein
MTAKYVEGGYGSFYIWKRNWIAYSEDQINAFDVWGKSASGDWVMPPISLTSEEGSEFSTLYGDITTYIDEMVTKFITGEVAITEFDSFVDKVKSMKIDRCIEIQQAALDRYNSR